MQALAVAMPAAIVAGTFTALAILFRFTRKFYKRKFNKQKSLIDDESLYLIATTELDDGPKNEALWAKAMALSKGDKEQARYKYIELRVEQLKKNVSQEDDKKNETTGTGEDESKEEGSDSEERPQFWKNPNKVLLESKEEGSDSEEIVDENETTGTGEEEFKMTKVERMLTMKHQKQVNKDYMQEGSDSEEIVDEIKKFEKIERKVGFSTIIIAFVGLFILWFWNR